MPKLILDESGEHKTGAFYQFETLWMDEPFEWDADVLKRMTIVPTTPTSEELDWMGDAGFIWLEMVGGYTPEDDEHQCPLDKTHVTRQLHRKSEADAFGGERVSDIISTKFCQEFVVSESFAKRWTALPFRSSEVFPVTVNVDQSKGLKGKLFRVEFLGRDCLRHDSLQGVPNVCPFCGLWPVVCPGCRHRMYTCDRCKREIFASAGKHEGLADKRISLDAASDHRKRGDILDGRRWDGSDLINCNGTNFISKRVLNWLQSVHAAPFCVRPTRFCVDGMSRKQREWLDEVQKTVPG